jgi:hypothetical protein
MLGNLTNPSERFLDPMERISEILFGLIMVLTFQRRWARAAAYITSNRFDRTC